MRVNIKKLHPNAIIPTYAHETDAGLDLTATSYEYDNRLQNHIYGTGLAFEIPEGYVGLIFPRSSNRKTDSFMCNHVGVLDSSYRGEVMLTFKNRDNIEQGSWGDMLRPYSEGERIGQLIIVPYPIIEFVEVDKLSETERGEAGHGSTGN